MENVEKDIFFVVQYKGGAGKSTFSSQFLIPFLHEKYNSKKELSDKSNILVKYYEVDAENDENNMFSESLIVKQNLINNSTDELANVLNKEFSRRRDYPLVFDIGVAHTNNALKTLSKAIVDEKINFLIPLKNDSTDFNDLVSTVVDVKNLFSDANFIVVFSDAQSSYNNKYLKQEFGIAFGQAINFETQKFGINVFETAGIKPQFVSIKKTEHIITSKFSFRKSLYECAKEGHILNTMHHKATLNMEINQLKTEMYSLDSKEENKAKIEDLENKISLLMFKRTFFRNCDEYAKEHLYPLFKIFDSFIAR
jgi:hypothetical protein